VVALGLSGSGWEEGEGVSKGGCEYLGWSYYCLSSCLARETCRIPKQHVISELLTAVNRVYCVFGKY